MALRIKYILRTLKELYLINSRFHLPELYLNLNDLMKIRYSAVFFILLLYNSVRPHSVYAQTEVQAPDSLLSKMAYYGIKKSSSVLFAHFDKTIYVNNENVWFTAYLLNYNKKKSNPTFLSVLLVNDGNRTISIEQRFIMADGLSFGNVLIPDTIPPGNYSFILYTNELINGKPLNTFTQHITIKTTSKPAISTELALDDTSKLGYHKVMIKVTDRDGRPLSGATVNYNIGNLSGKIKTDQFGQYELLISAMQVVEGDNILYADVSYKKDTRNVQLAIPIAKNKIKIKFYPEGGSMVNATQCIVGWEAKDVYDKPVRLNAVIYKDRQIVDTIGTDSYGMGRFKFTPVQGSEYQVKLIGVEDTIYRLPKILNKGLVMRANKSIANDSLWIRLTSKYAGKYYLFIHNYKQSFFYVPVEIGTADKNILINLADIPKGLNTITVLDSLQRPWAERIFFAHYNQRVKADITIDKPEYTTRQKVELKIKLNSPALDTLKGIASIACVQSNRMEIRNTNDIESYVYLRNELENMPMKEKYMGQKAEDVDYLENVLLIKGWRRYTWQEMQMSSVKDTISELKRVPAVEADVIYYGKPLKKSEKVVAMTDSAVNIIKTDNTGHFTLNESQVITAPNKKVYLYLNDPDNSIKVSNVFNDLNNQVTKYLKPEYDNLFSAKSVNTDAQIIRGFEHAINLKTVTIKGTKDGNLKYSSHYTYGSNACGDYVCYLNVLNCQNHANRTDNRPPKIGEKYLVETKNVDYRTMRPTARSDAYLSEIYYTGCTIPKSATSVTISGIKYSREFYGEDYSKLNHSEPEYQSTIFWKHACFIDSKGETKLSFYTSDITGSFKIIIQGITDNDVIYGEREFKIKKP